VNDLLEPAVSPHGGMSRSRAPGWCLDHERDLVSERQSDAEEGRSHWHEAERRHGRDRRHGDMKKTGDMKGTGDMKNH
jgi:hypothetical protein